MKEYLIEISLDSQQEVNNAITALLKYGLMLDKAFAPKKLSVSPEPEKPFKNNYLIKGYMYNTNTKNLLSNYAVANVWKSSGYIPF